MSLFCCESLSHALSAAGRCCPLLCEFGLRGWGLLGDVAPYFASSFGQRGGAGGFGLLGDAAALLCEFGPRRGGGGCWATLPLTLRVRPDGRLLGDAAGGG